VHPQSLDREPIIDVDGKLRDSLSAEILEVDESFSNLCVLVINDGSDMSFSSEHISTATLTPCMAFHHVLTHV